MTRESFYLSKRSLNRQLFNPTTLKHRDFEAHIATAKNCGTHWIKYMLSLALAEKYGLPAPAHIRDDLIVGHTKHRPVYSHIPQIAITHSHPHYLLRAPRIFFNIQLPQFVVLVRDIPAILVSMYEKTRGEALDQKMRKKDVDFSTYLHGDVTGRTRIEDIWGLILFFNAWGAVIEKVPQAVMPVRYEDLSNHTLATLRAICNHIPLELEDKYLVSAIAKSSRQTMKDKNHPDKEKAEKIVNTEDRDYMQWYRDEDLDFLRDTCRKHLKYNFGYKY